MQFKFPKAIDHLTDVLPPREITFRAFELCPIEKTKVIISGQDPYPTRGNANGLAFSVYKGQKIPKSLNNIFTELVADIGCPVPLHGDLTSWAEQGVLLANAALSTEVGVARAHKKHWKEFTQSWVKEYGQRAEPIVWILWGDDAKEYIPLIGKHHKIISSVHPSPLSAYKGFYGSKPFSKANDYLVELGHEKIDWSVKDKDQLDLFTED
jgi:uracil-DNA glycosylase